MSEQLSFDFETLWVEQVIAELCGQAEQLQEQWSEYNIAFQGLLVNLCQIAGCSLEDWPDETVMTYARLCIEHEEEWKQ